MAVDTAAKRLSILDWGEELGQAPTPDGSFANKPDRQHLLGLYSGIDATSGAATALTSTDQGIPFWGSSFSKRGR